MLHKNNYKMHINLLKIINMKYKKLNAHKNKGLMEIGIFIS